MASIDKTYVTVAQWKLAKQFWDETNAKQIADMGECIRLYHESADDIYDDCVLWNTSVIHDIWLYKNCPLDFIQKRLAAQYNWGEKGPVNSPLFEQVDFSSPAIYIISINSEKINVNFHFPDPEEEGTSLVLDETDTILVYGTSYFLQVIEQVTQSIKGRPAFNGKFIINFFGCDLLYSDGKFKISETGQDVELPYLNDRWLKCPKINYSFKAADIEKYPVNYIFFSADDSIYGLSDYKEADKYKNRKALYRFEIPQYILQYIK